MDQRKLWSFSLFVEKIFKKKNAENLQVVVLSISYTSHDLFTADPPLWALA